MRPVVAAKVETWTGYRQMQVLRVIYVYKEMKWGDHWNNRLTLAHTKQSPLWYQNNGVERTALKPAAIFSNQIRTT